MLKIEKNVKFILLVEGITEKILLPRFSKIYGVDFEKLGIKLISSGGKNRIFRLYNKIINEFKIPVFMVFDSDAEELIAKNTDIIRKTDTVFVIKAGEFEDILPNKLILRALNDHYRFSGRVDSAELTAAGKKSQLLYDLYKLKGFGDFKKAEFANILSGYITNDNEYPKELKDLIQSIKRAFESNVSP